MPVNDDHDDADSDDEKWSFETSEAYRSFVRRTQLLRSQLTPDKIAWFNANKIPLYCLAKHSNESVYNRARIVSAFDEDQNEDEDEDEEEEDEEREDRRRNERTRESENGGKFKVFFVDYGDLSTVTIEDILPMEEKFVKQLPFQAIECSLNGLKPLIDVRLIFF